MVTRATLALALARAILGVTGGLAGRKPRLLFRLSTVFLFRFEVRKFSGLLFQEPPRITR